MFFFDLGTTSVTSAVTRCLPASLPASAVIAGVAYQPGSGDVFLSARDGLNNDRLLRVPAASSTALPVGSLSHGDGFSFVSDIDFDASGTLYAMTWFNRWFYSVSTTTAATTFVSSGPHRDSTGLALSPVPEPAGGLFALLGAALVAARARRCTQQKTGEKIEKRGR